MWLLSQTKKAGMHSKINSPEKISPGMRSANDYINKIILTGWAIWLCSMSQARTWTVGIHEQFQTIQAALAHCKAFDSILVTAGSYHEKNMVIDKPIFLVGKNFPVLDGEHKYEIIT